MDANDSLQDYNGKKAFTNKSDKFKPRENQKPQGLALYNNEEYLQYQLSANDKKEEHL